MFIRFVSSFSHPNLDVELGMFAARDLIDFSKLKGSIQTANDEAFYWFRAGGSGGLAYPRLNGKVRTPKIRKSLSWFKEDAKFFWPKNESVISRARDLASALELAGCEIREIRMTDPGELIWEDSIQVLAMPSEGHIPKAF